MSGTAGGPRVAIERGTIIVYRIFDVAEKFDLKRIASDLGAGLASSRLKIARNTGHALILRDAPITLSLGAAKLRLCAATVRAELTPSARRQRCRTIHKGWRITSSASSSR